MVYTVTRAGAAPAADATVPGRTHEGLPHGQQPGVAAPDGIVSPCFSYAPDRPPGTADDAGDSLGSPRRMPHPCFAYFPDLRPGISNHDATMPASASVRWMPGEIGPCFRY